MIRCSASSTTRCRCVLFAPLISGEKVYSIRLPRFISLQFRPWPLVTLTEEQKKNVRRMLPLTSEKYRKQHEQMEALKHINEIRKKLGAIDAFLAKKKEIYAKMAEVEAERKKLYGKEPEWVEVWVVWNRGDE